MNIGGIDHYTQWTHEAIAEQFALVWREMLIQDADCENRPEDMGCYRYDSQVPLPNEFFLYRNQAAFDQCDEGRDDPDDNALEGMVYVVDRTVIYHHNTSDDVAQIIAKIPKEEATSISQQSSVLD